MAVVAAGLAVGAVWPAASARSAPAPEDTTSPPAPDAAAGDGQGPPPAGAPLAGAVELDARSAAILAIRPTDLGDGFALLDLLSGVFPETVGTFDRGRDAVGLYSFGRGELRERGLDPDALVLMSWGRVDADDWPKTSSTGRAAKAQPPVWARHRLVAKIGQDSGQDASGKPADETKLEQAFAQALQKRGAAVARLPRPRGAAPTPAWANPLLAAAKRASVRILARTPGGDLVSLRVRGGRAIIDWAEPWAGKVKPQDSKKMSPLFAKMLAAPRTPLSQELSRPLRGLLASPQSSISAVLSPSALAGLSPRASCRAEGFGEGALLDEVAVLLRMHPFDWKLEMVWTLTAPGRTAFQGVAADDGLADGRAIVHNGLAAGALLVSSLDAVAGGAGRGRERAASALAALRAADGGCGAAGSVAALARYWPQMGRAVVDEALPILTTSPPDARPRNVVAVLGDRRPPPRGWIDSITYFVSFPATASARLEQVLAVQGTKAERQSFGDRTPRFFDFGSIGRFEEAALEPLAAGHVGLAMAPPGTGLGWYYRMRRRPARLGAQTNVGFLHVNVGRLLGMFAAEADAATQSAVKLAASQFGLLGGNLTLEEGTLRLDLTLSPP